MSDTELRQRLAAILAADAAGYSRLMAAGERETIAMLDAARAIFRAAVESNQGRVIDTAGDSVLAVFDSAAGAVSAALAVQQELNDVSSAAPEDRRLRFRIGVHLGDIIEKADGTVYGDGVNVAARLQSLASPGSITVSDSVRAAVRNRVAASFEDRGEHAVKNIPHPLHAYTLLAQGAASASGTPRDPPDIAGKPTLAVLAFDNMSGDPAQEYFCDGIAEDIITDLSKIGGLAVIGRQSSFAYKGRKNDLRQVARELGVRYVLEGSVRTSGDRVRINAQLIEAEAGTHVWASRYDRAAGDAFLIGDEIAEHIVTALDVKLARGEDAKVWRKALKVPEAREAFFRGQEAYFQGSAQNLRRAREYFLEAIRLEPESAQAHASAAVTHVLDVIYGWSEDAKASLALAERLTARALELDAFTAAAHYAKGMIWLFNGQHQLALDEGRQALDIRPMCSGPRAGLAYMELYSGKMGAAIKHAEEAVTLNPVFPGWYLYVRAAAEHFGGRPAQALAALDRALEAVPGLVPGKVLRIAVLHELGRVDEARAVAKEILRDAPDLTPERVAATHPFRDATARERFLGVLRQAGLFAP